MKNEINERKPVSIGRLAAETGISTERLRIWERRYGNPEPIRRPSGHRRYPWEQVVRMRRVSELLARGERAGTVLRLSPEELEARVLATEPDADAQPDLSSLLEAVRALRGEDLRRELLSASRELDLLAFLEQRVVPLMHEIGLRWSDGRLEIRHEHFAARAVASVLEELRPQSRGTAGTAVLATLPGELHGLALRMLGLLCLERGYRVQELDVDVPPREIALAATESRAALVAVSVSSASHLHDSFRDLRDLLALLPAGCSLLAGGDGATRGQRGPRGVHLFRDLRSFRSWLQKGARAASGGLLRPSEGAA